MARFADLPAEVLDFIGDYLDTGVSDIKSLVLVSSWLRQQFHSHLWKHVTVRSKTPLAFVSLLKDRAHFVHSIRFMGAVPKELYHMHFPGLIVFEHDNSVRVVAKAGEVCRILAGFFRLNPTIQDIIINPRDLSLNESFWNAIFTSLHNPRRLKLGREDAIMKLTMGGGSGLAFWKACGRFEHVEYMGWDQSRALRNDVNFDCSRLRILEYMTTSRPENTPGLWKWMGRCSNLTRLHWGGMVLAGQVHADAELPIWSHLEELSLGDVRETDETLARVIFAHLPPTLKHLRLKSAIFGPVSFDMLRERVFDSLNIQRFMEVSSYRLPMNLGLS
ncbi:hypothetical protein BG015_002189 [Linnemannia schmuckeri]|uniref:Uncharacterized protein n=1 Tax=Linnemannia schmuckeri TaxID=64567 RepID=A0A9P5V6H6_9FUNG|nr:hypothetical protein BG015_002189 [Linnemannia schmuckeri]